MRNYFFQGKNNRSSRSIFITWVTEGLQIEIKIWRINTKHHY
jgi:hypothetical protein